MIQTTPELLTSEDDKPTLIENMMNSRIFERMLACDNALVRVPSILAVVALSLGQGVVHPEQGREF